MSNNENNRLSANFLPGCGCDSKDSVASPNGLKNTLNIINNRAQYFAKIAQGCLEEVRTLLAQVREYAAQNTNVTVEYVTNKIAELRNTIESALNNYLLKSNLNSELVAFGTTAQYVNSTQLSTAIASVIPSQTNNEDKILSTDGEDLQWVPIPHDYSFFDIIPKDHILSYAETKGFAQLGTYVYKEAAAGTRYGYPDFYAKCVAEKIAGDATTATIAGVTVTTYVNPNGHVFYDVADKTAFDDLYTATGEAWYYGIDTENERIFLPRSTRIKFGGTSDVGKYQEAGLPQHTHTLTLPNVGGNNASWNSAAWGGDDASYRSNTGTTSNASNAIYGKSNTVEYSSTMLIPYMVVGNNVVTSVEIDAIDITTTENDTIPLGASKYSGDLLDSHLGWLKSEGQWNSGEVYTAFYNKAVAELGSGFANGVIVDSTDTYTDYDLVLNQTNQTFRLPLLDGSEDLLGGEQTELTLSSNDVSFTAQYNGTYVFAGNPQNNSGTWYINAATSRNGVEVDRDYRTINGSYQGRSVTVKALKSDVVRFWTGLGASYVTTHYFVKAIGNGDLYFKVANAVQNLDLLDAGEVLNAVEDIAAMPHIIETYVSGTSWYRVYSDGWCEQGGYTKAGTTINLLKPYVNTNYNIAMGLCSSSNDNGATEPKIAIKSTTQFKFNQAYNNNATYNVASYEWKLAGYIS